MRTRLVYLLVCVTLLVPEAAFGQSAGDEQYEDPFAPEPAQNEGNDRGGAQEEEPVGGGTSQEPDPAPAAPEPAATAAESPNGGDQLPRTGADEGLVALAGAVMLAGGIALRVRTR
jgi:LPXTG-motif cell wall-anchored protein